jgi:hypothetical protein
MSRYYNLTYYWFKRRYNQKWPNLKQILTLYSKEIQKVIKEKKVNIIEDVHLASEQTREVEFLINQRELIKLEQKRPNYLVKRSNENLNTRNSVCSWWKQRNLDNMLTYHNKTHIDAVY